MIVIQSQNGLEWKLGTIDDDFNDLIKSDKTKNFVSCSLPVKMINVKNVNICIYVVVVAEDGESHL